MMASLRSPATSREPPSFFATPAAWRRWLERHHRATKELWVGFWKRHTGKPSITWPESVDEALCYGWIDGLRRSRDADSYVIRFTPRKPDSHWSLVNVRRVAVLKKERRMRPAGLEVFAARDEKKSGTYSFEQRRSVKLTGAYLKALKADAAAWRFFSAQAPWYRRTAAFYVMSAKKEETRQRRLATVIADSARGRRIGILNRS
jgi:uncharacterized protein YdeI (YjbR/CyaY-like superfamily)